MPLQIGNTSSLELNSTQYITVGELIVKVRRKISEREAEYWTDADIISSLDEAEKEIYSELTNIGEGHLFSTTDTIDLVTDTELYSLPTDFKRIYSVERILSQSGATLTDPIKLDSVPYRLKDRYTGRAAPFLYYILGTQIGFRPVPSQSETASIRIRYQKRPSDLNESSDVSAIPKQWSYVLVLRAAIDLLGDEGDTAEQWRANFRRGLELMTIEEGRLDESRTERIHDTYG